MTNTSEVVSIPAYMGSGIYILLLASEAVYVGKSTNILARIGTHARTKKFDRVKWIPAEPEHLDAMERELISKLRPVYNEQFK